uniref:Uncharacterized protein n=1 Tax=Sphenodon punctatus TaxID=8508 RepID=A0A8D0HIN2_SPHPU
MSPESAAAKVKQPIILLSCDVFGSSMAASTPVKSSEDPLLYDPCFSAKTVLVTPASLKRSAMPTPIGRRTSGIPTMTPRTMPRSSSSSSQRMPFRQVSTVLSKKTPSVCSEQAKEIKTQVVYSPSVSVSEDDLSPPLVVPLTLDFSPEKAIPEIEQYEIQQTDIPKEPAENIHAK